MNNILLNANKTGASAWRRLEANPVARLREPHRRKAVRGGGQHFLTNVFFYPAFNHRNRIAGSAGLRWRPLPKAEAPTEPAGETKCTTGT